LPFQFSISLFRPVLAAGQDTIPFRAIHLLFLLEFVYNNFYFAFTCIFFLPLPHFIVSMAKMGFATLMVRRLHPRGSLWTDAPTY
jgi:hypothetical protein